MKTERWLIIPIALLSIAIALSGFFISKSVSTLSIAEPKQQVVMEQKSNEDILSLSEAAIYLKISEEKLKFLVDKSDFKDGRGIPYYKIDNNILFSKTALSKWIVYISQNQFEY